MQKSISLKCRNYIYFTESQIITQFILLQSGILASEGSLKVPKMFNANGFAHMYK